MTPFQLGITIGLAVVALWWFIRPRPSERVVVDDDMIDREILRAAEQEVAELDANITPEEAAEEIPDWGPGAPRP